MEYTTVTPLSTTTSGSSKTSYLVQVALFKNEDDIMMYYSLDIAGWFNVVAQMEVAIWSCWFTMQVSLHIVPDLAKLGHEECHHIKDAGMK